MICDGDETRLLHCPRVHEVAIGEHNCRHSEDVGIRCLATGQPANATPGEAVEGAMDSDAPALSWEWPSDQDMDALDASGRGLSDLAGVWRLGELHRLNLSGNRVSEPVGDSGAHGTAVAGSLEQRDRGSVADRRAV